MSYESMSSREEDPKIVVMYPTVTTQNSKQKEVIWKQPWLLVRRTVSNPLRVNIFFFWDQNQERFGGWKKVQYSTTANGLSCVERNPSGFFS